MEWYVGPLKKYAEFSGRASRKELWLFALFNTLAYLVLAFIFAPVGVLYAFGTWPTKQLLAPPRLRTPHAAQCLASALDPTSGGIS